jgi:hypothetical protein
MRRLSFLPKKLLIAGLATLSWAFFHWSLGAKLLLSGLAILVLFIFRRAVIPYRDTLKNDGEIFLSPIHGVVEGIRRDSPALGDGKLYHEVRISMGFWNEKGLYLPTAGELSYLKYQRGRKVSRRATKEVFYDSTLEFSHTDFILMSKNQTQTILRFIDSEYGQRPTIWLKSGDRGRGGACFGYYPFGGSLIIYLPQNSDILVFEKETLIPGQSVIASIRDLK